jgi:membrane-associated protease RseP (regulator of RpoE activity)
LFLTLNIPSKENWRYRVWYRLVALGGYVKISGMIDESMDKEQMALPPQPWEFRSKPAYQRLIIMLGGVTVNFILAFIYISGWSLFTETLILPMQI